MSLTSTLTGLALGLATETGGTLLDNTFDAAADLASSDHGSTHNSGRSLSQHLGKNPRHALSPNPSLTRFLAKSPLTTPAHDLALTPDLTLLQAGLGDDLAVGITRHVLEWSGSDNLRFYGEPLLLLALVGGTGLAGLGIGAVTLRALYRKLVPGKIYTITHGDIEYRIRAHVKGKQIGATLVGAKRISTGREMPLAQARQELQTASTSLVDLVRESERQTEMSKRTLAEAEDVESGAEVPPQIINTRDITLEHGHFRVIIREEISQKTGEKQEIHCKVLSVEALAEEAEETTAPGIPAGATKENEKELKLRDPSDQFGVTLRWTTYVGTVSKLYTFAYEVINVTKIPPAEDPATEVGGHLDVDPPSTAEPPTKVGGGVDEVLAGGTPVESEAAPPVGGETTTGLSSLTFGSAPPVTIDFTDFSEQYRLPGVVTEDVELDLDDNDSDDAIATEEAPDDLNGLEDLMLPIVHDEGAFATAEDLQPADTSRTPLDILKDLEHNAEILVTDTPVTSEDNANWILGVHSLLQRLEATFADETTYPDGTTTRDRLRRLQLTIYGWPINAGFADGLGLEFVRDEWARLNPAPAPTPAGEDLDDDAGAFSFAFETEEVAAPGESGTDPGSQQQQEQLLLEVLAEVAASAPPASSTTTGVHHDRLRPEDLPEPAHPIEPLPERPTRRASLTLAGGPLPVTVGPPPPAEAIAAPVVDTGDDIDPPTGWVNSLTPVAPDPTLTPPTAEATPDHETLIPVAPPIVMPSPSPLPAPVPKPTIPDPIALFMTGVRDFWDEAWNLGARFLSVPAGWMRSIGAALPSLGGTTIRDAEIVVDPLAYTGPVAGSKDSMPLNLRVPIEHQQIKDKTTIPGHDGSLSLVFIDLNSRPLQSFLERTFPYANTHGLDAQSTARVIGGLYSNMLASGNPFTRVARQNALMDRNLDSMIIDGHLRNERFAAIMMQLAFERVGIYSEIVVGTIGDRPVTTIAVYPNDNYRGTPVAYINVTNSGSVSTTLEDFTSNFPSWLPQPSLRGRRS